MKLSCEICQKEFENKTKRRTCSKDCKIKLCENIRDEIEWGKVVDGMIEREEESGFWNE